MSADAPLASEDRLLTFELGGSIWALPIAGVAEVTEIERVTCIPTLPSDLGGVINFHGDALPVIRAAALLDLEGHETPATSQVVAVTDRPTGAARLGIPVDRVLGLVNGESVPARGRDPVAERRSIDGRVMNLLDPKRLVEHAREVISAAAANGPVN